MIGLRLQRYNPGGPLVPNRNTDTATRIVSSQSLILFLPCWMKESWEVLVMIGADQEEVGWAFVLKGDSLPPTTGFPIVIWFCNISHATVPLLQTIFLVLILSKVQQ